MRVQTAFIGGLEFWLVGCPELQRGADGTLYEYTHTIPAEQRLNAHAAGPFCRFGLPAAPRAAGIYAILVAGALKYVGRCEDLAARFGARGYGQIYARNLHYNGQSTNCKLNAKVLAAAKAGTPIQVWFHSTADFVRLEADLILALAPEWNGRPPGSRVASIAKRVIRSAAAPLLAKVSSKQQPSESDGLPTRYDFDRELCRIFDEAASSGASEIEISAGQLHRSVGCYPGKHHRMPVCCARMRAAMINQDRITYAPPKGNGASMTVRYFLPRM